VTNTIDYFELNTIVNQQVAFFYTDKKPVISFVFHSISLDGSNGIWLKYYHEPDLFDYILVSESDIKYQNQTTVIFMELDHKVYRAMRLLIDNPGLGKHFK
jgi:hypothetical protein